MSRFDERIHPTYRSWTSTLAGTEWSRTSIRNWRPQRRLRVVPRHEFVPAAWRDLEYADRPLPIGDGQTISAPSIVADVCDRLAIAAGDRSLEIGTGSGYHAAVTAEIVGAEHVSTVEIEADLHETDRKRMTQLGYEGMSVRVADGRDGQLDHAPFDKVYMTCAVRANSPALIEQTRIGGLFLAPIGLADWRLVLAKKRDDVMLDRVDCGRVEFVPMQGPDV